MRTCRLTILEKGKPAERLGRKAQGRLRTVAELPKGCSAFPWERLKRELWQSDEGTRHNISFEFVQRMTG